MRDVKIAERLPSKMENSKYLEFISLLGQAPKSQLDEKFSKECREFSGDDPVRFLRNLQDKCVFYSGSSGFLIQVIDHILTNEVESKKEANARREVLEKEMQL